MFSHYSQLGQQSGSCLRLWSGCFSRSASSLRFWFLAFRHCLSLPGVACCRGCRHSCCSVAYLRGGFAFAQCLSSAASISTSSTTHTWIPRLLSVSLLVSHSRSIRCERQSGDAGSLDGYSFPFTLGCLRRHFGISTDGMSGGVTKANERAGGKRRIASLFHAGSSRPALPQHQR